MGIYDLRNRYQNYGWVFIGADFFTEGGAWRSIYKFFQFSERQGENPLIINLSNHKAIFQILLAFLFSRNIVVNGLSAFKSWVLLLVLFLRKDTAIYLHDTAHVLNGFQSDNGIKYKILSKHLKTHRILCVSRQMEKLYRQRFGCKSITVVYEITNLEPIPPFESGIKHILMIGTLNSRKGFPLFREVAELARVRSKNWQFHWIGSLGEKNLYVSHPLIQWWGWQDSSLSFLQKADLLFLSSIDDPQPLACLEALALFKRVVVFKETGTSELVTQLKGCAVFNEYVAKSAYEAIDQVLQEEVDPAQIRKCLKRYASADAFNSKIRELFGMPLCDSGNKS